jgi:hypothetical protein
MKRAWNPGGLGELRDVNQEGGPSVKQVIREAPLPNVRPMGVAGRTPLRFGTGM